jgi:hypothetical protein
VSLYDKEQSVLDEPITWHVAIASGDAAIRVGLKRGSFERIDFGKVAGVRVGAWEILRALLSLL